MYLCITIIIPVLSLSSDKKVSPRSKKVTYDAFSSGKAYKFKTLDWTKLTLTSVTMISQN